jgi:putative hemolysin
MTLDIYSPRKPQQPIPQLPGVPSIDGARYPRHARGVPPGVHRSGRYLVRFANRFEDLQRAQRLRFEVFNMELNEGLAQSHLTGLDRDDYDLDCHHLLVEEAESGQIVGTYRLMTTELVSRAGLYTASEFDLAEIPDHVLEHGAEVGRACIAKDHRNGRVLQLLWRGIARYLDWNDKRYVFGCCSVPTLDPAEIGSVTLRLALEGRLHPQFNAPVHAALREGFGDTVVAHGGAVLPPLFQSYLRLGAKVCGGPASDREFCVTDYLVLLDLRDVDPRVLASLAAPGHWNSEA